MSVVLTDKQIQRLICDRWRYVRAAAEAVEQDRDQTIEVCCDPHRKWTRIRIDSLPAGMNTSETKIAHGDIFDLEEL